MANCCVAKQSHRTQAHPTPPSKFTHLPTQTQHLTRLPLPTATQNAPYHGNFFQTMMPATKLPWVMMLPPLSLSLSSVVISLTPSLSCRLPFSLLLLIFLLLSWVVDEVVLCWLPAPPSPGFGLSLFSCSGKRQYEVLHNFYLYLPCCFCHLFFSLLLLTLLLLLL